MDVVNAGEIKHFVPITFITFIPVTSENIAK